MSAHSPERIVLAKIGLDGHDRGLRVLVHAMREAGMEVIYLGPWAEIDEVVAAAIQEDADVVGVSSLAYDHLLVPRLIEELRDAGFVGDVLVGGTIQAADIPALTKAGVARVFHPGEPLEEITDYIRGLVNAQREALDGARR